VPPRGDCEKPAAHAVAVGIRYSAKTALTLYAVTSGCGARVPSQRASHGVIIMLRESANGAVDETDEKVSVETPLIRTGLLVQDQGSSG
jgi:hypothetical protein